MPLICILTRKRRRIPASFSGRRDGGEADLRRLDNALFETPGRGVFSPENRPLPKSQISLQKR